MEKRPFPRWQLTSLGRAPQRELESLPFSFYPKLAGAGQASSMEPQPRQPGLGQRVTPARPPRLPTPELAAGHELPSLDLAVVGQVPQNPPQPPIPSLFLSSLPL